MKKTTTTGWMLLALSFFAGTTFISSCSSDKDIDLGELDKTIGVGGDEFTVKGGKLENSLLGDLLKIKEGDVIDTLKRDSADNKRGDFLFTRGDTIKWATPKVKEVRLNEPDIHPGSVHVYIPADMDPQGQPEAVKELIHSKHLSFPDDNEEPQRLASFDVKGAGDENIVQLTQAEVEGVVNLKVNLGVLNGKVSVARLDLYLPNFFIVDGNKDISVDQKDYNVDADVEIVQGTDEKGKSNSDFPESLMDDFWRIRLENISTDKSRLISLNLQRIDNIKDKVDPDWDEDYPYMLFDSNGPLLHGIIKMRITLDGKDFLDGCSGEYDIESDVDFGDDHLVFTHAEGRFDPEINISPSNISMGNDIPDFLSDDEVVINIHNPSIKFEVSNNINVEAIANGHINAFYKNGAKKRIYLPDIAVRQSPDMNPVNTTVVLCRYQPKQQIAGIQYIELNSTKQSWDNDTLVVGDLGLILQQIPDSLQFVMDARVNTEKEGKFDLYRPRYDSNGNEVEHYDLTEHGCGYQIKPKYHFSAPLQLDPGSRIFYTDTIADLHKDLSKKDIDFYGENSYLMVRAYIKNNSPLQLRITSPKAIGLKNANGEAPELTDVSVTLVDAEGTPLSDATIGSEGGFYLKVTGSLKNLDGIIFKVEANSQRVETLNASLHSVAVEDIELTVNGRVSIDLDK